jgi:hypothetical protein
MTKGTKIGLIIGSIVLIGGGIGAYFYFKKKKENEVTDDLTDTKMPDIITPIESTPVMETRVSEINVEEPPVEVPVDVKKLSYDRVLKRFQSSPRTKQYSDYFTYTVTPTMLGLQGLPKDYTARVKFQKDGGWRLHLLNRGKEVKFLTGGLYYKAGTRLVGYNGINKGLIVSGDSPVDNVKRMATA